MNVECNKCGKEFWIASQIRRQSRLCKECTNTRNRARRQSPKYINDKNKKTLEKHGQEAYDKMPSCKLCELELKMEIGTGYRSNDLVNHIIKFHKAEVENYKRVFGVPVRSEDYLKDQSVRIKGDKNPGYQHGGKLSPFSTLFYTNKGFSEEDAELMAKEAQTNKVYVKGNSPNQKEYWMKRGYKESEAIHKVAEVQTTFSKDICIEKYGEEEGIKTWKERQGKWIKTMNNKSPEEKERIYKAKMNNGRSYSKISQELFTKIYSKIGGRYICRFATLQGNGIVKDTGINNEYMVTTISGSYRFLDFYATDIDGNEWNVEYDGEYWHNEQKIEGNKTRDELREEQIIETMPNMKILHIREADYKKNPEAEVQKCINFIEKDINILYESTG